MCAAIQKLEAKLWHGNWDRKQSKAKRGDPPHFTTTILRRLGPNLGGGGVAYVPKHQKGVQIAR